MPDCVSHPVSCLNDVFQFIFYYHVLGPCLQVANIRRSCEKRGKFTTTAPRLPAFGEFAIALAVFFGRLLEIISYFKFIDLIYGIIPTVPKLGAFAHPTCGSGVIVRTECLGFRQVRELAQEEDGGEDQTSRWADHV